MNWHRGFRVVDGKTVEVLESVIAKDEYEALVEVGRAERGRAEHLIRQYLLHDSQRAVSWHEVQDCLEALSREPEKGRP